MVKISVYWYVCLRKGQYDLLYINNFLVLDITGLLFGVRPEVPRIQCWSMQCSKRQCWFWTQSKCHSMPGLPFISNRKNKTHTHMYSILKIALLEPLQGSICRKLHFLHTKSGSENMWDMDYQEWGIWGDLHKTCRTWYPMEERSFMSNWSLQCKRIALYFR